MRRAVLNLFWKIPNKMLYDNLPPISDVRRERRTRFAGHVFQSKDSYAMILDVWILPEQWKTERDGEHA